MKRPDSTDIKTQLAGLVDKAVGTVQAQAGRLLHDKEMEAKGAHKVMDGEVKLHGAPPPAAAAPPPAAAAPPPAAAAPSPTTLKRARNGKTRHASRR